jgi:GT2 family glycosyltransferase
MIKRKQNPECDIVIVVHNALPFVRRCIESIKKHTDYPFNLVIIDNCSNYETKIYLKTLNAKVITNLKNYGFGYANNQGIKISVSEYICFLNSDTIVTENWLSKLIKILEQKNAGIIGPVTNCISSEVQLIKDFPASENDELTIQNYAVNRFKQYSYETIETTRLIGFCMLTKREVLDEAGLFDDRYKFNFEDDDLCLRVIEHGYKLFCSNGIFVFHFGSQSFKEKYNVITCDTILEKSKELYIDKWYKTGRINRLYELHNRFSKLFLNMQID